MPAVWSSWLSNIADKIVAVSDIDRGVVSSGAVFAAEIADRLGSEQPERSP
jgi:hypothetical protein